MTVQRKQHGARELSGPLRDMPLDDATEWFLTRLAWLEGRLEESKRRESSYKGMATRAKTKVAKLADENKALLDETVSHRAEALRALEESRLAREGEEKAIGSAARSSEVAASERARYQRACSDAQADAEKRAERFIKRREAALDGAINEATIGMRRALAASLSGPYGCVNVGFRFCNVYGEFYSANTEWIGQVVVNGGTHPADCACHEPWSDPWRSPRAYSGRLVGDCLTGASS